MKPKPEKPLLSTPHRLLLVGMIILIGFMPTVTRKRWQKLHHGRVKRFRAQISEDLTALQEGRTPPNFPAADLLPIPADPARGPVKLLQFSVWTPRVTVTNSRGEVITPDPMFPVPLSLMAPVTVRHPDGREGRTSIFYSGHLDAEGKVKFLHGSCENPFPIPEKPPVPGEIITPASFADPLPPTPLELQPPPRLTDRPRLVMPQEPPPCRRSHPSGGADFSHPQELHLPEPPASGRRRETESAGPRLPVRPAGTSGSDAHHGRHDETTPTPPSAAFAPGKSPGQ